MLAASERRVAIVIDPNQKHAGGDIAAWAVAQLRQTLSAKGAIATIAASAKQAGPADLFVVLTDGDDPNAPTSTRRTAPMKPEATRLASGAIAGKPAVWVSAIDPQGFVYGLLELAERVRASSDPSLGLIPARTIEEAPANTVRSMARAFVSEIEDKQWFYDKSFWRGYLDLLAASRFNRFNFAFGFGYDFPRGVTGDYFQFPYPYLLDVPGYKVRVVPLDDAERDRNLETFQFIAAETAARGLQFQVGIWTHAYQWTDSPHADHHIEGLTPATHAAYCRDALALLLKRCPQITGISLRVHGESGIPEGSYSFWQTLFDATANCDRKFEIDMHAKGIDQKMIDIAAATGMRVTVAPKFSSEHMGLGYHQADIRELEWPRPDAKDKGTFALSDGSRRFLRYGYGDLFQQGRRFDVLFRLWPGTQRFLLWGDPATAAAYGRSASFCGAVGLEICEPLTFKGREGSGLPGGRYGYPDETPDQQRNDFRKFDYTYRVWGRCLYNPDTPAEVWQRSLAQSFGRAAQPVYDALANASRVLPLMTTAHLPSASNHSYWPELYTNMPTIAARTTPPYPDTPDPKCFGTVSPLDPQLFLTAVEHAQMLLSGSPSAKYSPVEVAQWLERFAEQSSRALAAARAQAHPANAVAFRQMEEDVLIQIGLARFFADKMRAAVLFEIFLQTSALKAGEMAIAALSSAREAWAAMATRAAKVYRPDITYGSHAELRGGWLDRLPAIDGDLAAVRDLASRKATQPAATLADAAAALRAFSHPAQRLAVACTHTVAGAFKPGEPLPLAIDATSAQTPHDLAVTLWYRRVNQAERWSSGPMQRAQNRFTSAIPADCTSSPFPLQYYFELRTAGASPSLFPAFNQELSNQPYYVLSHRIA